MFVDVTPAIKKTNNINTDFDISLFEVIWLFYNYESFFIIFHLYNKQQKILFIKIIFLHNKTLRFPFWWWKGDTTRFLLWFVVFQDFFLWSINNFKIEMSDQYCFRYPDNLWESLTNNSSIKAETISLRKMKDEKNKKNCQIA